MVVGDRIPAVPAVATATTLALLIGLPAAHQTYQRSTGLARQRLQLVGCAVAVIVEVALVVAALNVLVDWPSHAAEVAAAATAPRARSPCWPAPAPASPAASTACSCTPCRPPGSPPWSWRCTS